MTLYYNMINYKMVIIFIFQTGPNMTKINHKHGNVNLLYHISLSIVST